MLEVVIGLASVALLTREPFDKREFAGVVFIIAACGSEVFARDRARTAERTRQ
jgi:drug/metabolite transporter (DMT)-like permease